MFRKKSLAYICMLSIMLTLSMTALSGCRKKGVDSIEWLLSTEDTKNHLKTFMDSFDTAVTLYQIGVYSPEEFFDEMDILNGQFILIKAVYDKWQSENPVLPGSFTEVSKHGYDGVNKIWKLEEERINKIFTLASENASADEISYVYMSYNRDVSDAMIEYISAYDVYTEEIYGLETEIMSE